MIWWVEIHGDTTSVRHTKTTSLVVFHQPIWKICASQIGNHFSRDRGENSKKKLKPPPRLTWQWKNNHLIDVSIVSPIEKRVDFPANHVIVFWKLLFWEVSLPFLTKQNEEKNEWLCRVHKFVSPPELTTKKNLRRAPPAPLLDDDTVLVDEFSRNLDPDFWHRLFWMQRKTQAKSS